MNELIEPDTPSGYLRARIEIFDDTDESAPPSEQTLETRVASLFRRMVGLMGVDEPRCRAATGRLSFRLAAAVDFGCRSSSACSSRAPKPSGSTFWWPS